MAQIAPDQMKRIPLSPSEETRLKNYLDFELQNSKSERRSFEAELIDDVRLYEALPQVSKKNFPWPDASNLVVPVGAAMVDTIFPRVYSTVFGVEPLITIEEKMGDWADHAKAIEHLLEISLLEQIRLQDIAVDWLLEGIVHGTSGVKILWEEIKKNVKGYDDEGQIKVEREKVVFRGPCVYRVPLNDLIIPFYAKSIVDAPWVAHRFRTYWAKIEEMDRQGKYQHIDRLKHAAEVTPTEYVRARQEIEHTEPIATEEYELFEIWLDYDIDSDGYLESLLVTYHLPTSTLLRVQYNPYWHLMKPFREFVYWPRHDRIYGMGIMRQIKDIQEEISTLHNQMIDNHTAGNTKMWEIVSGSTADRNFDGVAPGRKIRVDKLGEEIQPLELGSLINFDIQAEQFSLQYGQQRTGVSDFLSGMDMGGGGRETATTTMVRMQEARTRFNWTLDSARAALADVAWFVIALFQQFADERDVAMLVSDDEEVDLIMEVLGMSEEEVRSRFGLQVTGSSASLNKEAEKQNLIALVQLLQQHTMQFEMPLVNLVLNPQAPQEMKDWAMDKLNGLRKLFDRVLQTFDTRNLNEILGDLRTLEAVLTPEPGPAYGTPIPPAAAGVAGPVGQPGMAGAMGPLGMGI